MKLLDNEACRWIALALFLFGLSAGMLGYLDPIWVLPTLTPMFAYRVVDEWRKE